MPAFSRLSRHSNRSQHGLAESPTSAGAEPGEGVEGPGGPASATAKAAHQTSPVSLSNQNSASSTSAFSSSVGGAAALRQQQQQQQGSGHHPLPPLPVQQQDDGAEHQLQQPSGATGGGALQQRPLPPPPAGQFYDQGTNDSQASIHQQSFAAPPPPGKSQDFADLVSRSQSQRYPPVNALPGHAQSPYGHSSASLDDLQSTLGAGAPGQAAAPPSHALTHPQPNLPHHHLPSQQHHLLQQQQQQQQPPQQQPPQQQASSGKKSTRKLIKGIFQGTSRADPDHHSRAQPPPGHIPQNSYDNTAGLARRPSQRLSSPPSLRPGYGQQQQQLSLDQQQQSDWPPAQKGQLSPHRGVSQIEEEGHDYFETESPESYSHHQNPLEPVNTSIRRVPTDSDASPYAQDQQALYHQQQSLAQLQGATNEIQHQEYGRATFDPAGGLQQQQQPQYNPQSAAPPHIYTSHLAASGQPQNPETISQLSRDSPVADAEQRPTNTQLQPPSTYSVVGQDHPPPVSPIPGTGSPTSGQPGHQSMGSLGGQPPRRSQETDRILRQGEQPPANLAYRQSQALNPAMNPHGPPPGQPGQNPAYRSSDRPPQYEGQQDQGRNSPQPGSQADAGENKDKDLVLKYKNVKRLYFDGKSQIEQMTAQIEQLQNAVANQRLAHSRTSLDDNEYSRRFDRLNGAINNLSFNIRKNWRTLPPWLQKYVSLDAIKTGKQEMTAVGRAVISYWLMEEIFTKCFHPGLEPDLSEHLKQIEMNIRRFSYTMNSKEEYHALTTKVVNWRMATLDGLQTLLNSQQSLENRTRFTNECTNALTEYLYKFLTDPPPAGVDGSASIIVELAVGISSNLPMESRDVAITYPMPGDGVQPDLMEVEKGGLPSLEISKSDVSERDEEWAEGNDSGKEGGKDRRGDKNRSGTLASTRLGGGGGGSGSGTASRKGSLVSTRSINADATNAAIPGKETVRFAGFVAVEVRGRQVLMKAPVWTL